MFANICMFLTVGLLNAFLADKLRDVSVDGLVWPAVPPLHVPKNYSYIFQCRHCTFPKIFHLHYWANVYIFQGTIGQPRHCTFPKILHFLADLSYFCRALKPFGMLLQKYDLEITFSNTETIYCVFVNVSENNFTGKYVAHFYHWEGWGGGVGGMGVLISGSTLNAIFEKNTANWFESLLSD